MRPRGAAVDHTLVLGKQISKRFPWCSFVLAVITAFWCGFAVALWLLLA